MKTINKPVKKSKVKRFDFLKKANYFSPMRHIARLVAAIKLKGADITIKRVNMENLKPPYFILANHASVFDMAMSMVINYPHRTYNVVALDGLYDFTEPLMRSIGTIAKRKFIKDLALLKNMKYVVNNRKDAILMMYLTFRFMEEGSFDSVNGRTILLFMCNAFFIVAAYPIVYLLEKVFGFLSNATLMDLADTSNHLLMDLAKKAPGTFQHSLQVANLSEAAAREIDADALLIRVGAMYHDIGKIQNPQCFIENQPEGVNYHANLTPLESAQAIISHVDDGVAIAQKAGLPEVIVDFIRTHHGHTQTLYFYNQFCNAGGDPEMIDKFTYNGLLPSKKEHAILMMADGVEAASRSLKDYSEASISAMVDRLCDAKIIDSQFVECEISLKEIDIVKDVFKKYLVQIYHARIAYPERKDRKR